MFSKSVLSVSGPAWTQPSLPHCPSLCLYAHIPGNSPCALLCSLCVGRARACGKPGRALFVAAALTCVSGTAPGLLPARLSPSGQPSEYLCPPVCVGEPAGSSRAGHQER